MADNKIVGNDTKNADYDTKNADYDTKNADYDTKNAIENPDESKRRIKYFAERQIKDRTRIGVTKVQAKKAHRLGYSIEEAYSNAVDVKCSAFDFIAQFNKLKPGRYHFIYEIKLKSDFFMRWGFHFQAKINYEEDEDEKTGGLNVVIPKEKFENLRVGEWQKFTIKEHLIVRPHKGTAEVKLHLKNHENTDKDKVLVDEDQAEKSVDYKNFKIGNVEILKCTTHDIDINDIDSVHADPIASLNIKDIEDMPISRISAATEVDHIALLRHSKSTLHIGIWDFTEVQVSKTNNNPSTSFEFRTELVQHDQTGVYELPLGISLSPDGRYLAVFQEPLIGGWEDKEKSFNFQLFDTSIKTSKLRSSEIVLDIDMQPGLIPSNAISNIPSLRSFVGFAKFLPLGAPSGQPVGTPLRELSTEYDERQPESKKGRQYDNSLLFAACNGIYLDLFDCQEQWHHIHSITLTDLSPSVSRRITCQMMMESMGRNNFLWLDNQVCSVWSVMDGTITSHLMDDKCNTYLDGGVYQSNLKMALSPDESIIALATNDGSVQTFFTVSGIELRSRKFTSSKIEYVGFLSRDELLVVIRNSITHELSSKVFDPLDFRIRKSHNSVPIPTAGITLLINRQKGVANVKNQAMICTATGSALHFYRVQDSPPDQLINTVAEKMFMEQILEIPVPIETEKEKGEEKDKEEEEEVPEGSTYRLLLVPTKEPMENGDGRLYWVITLIIKQIHPSHPDKVLCEFVPEPWLRCRVNEYTRLRDLMTPYLLPCGKRFIIIGFQSIQIWKIPDGEKKGLELQAFWSSPKQDAIFRPNDTKIGSFVFKDFEIIENAKIYNDKSSLTRLTVQIIDKEKPEDIFLPGGGPDTIHYGFIPCCRSIHLIAAAYSFAKEGKHQAHASALHSFTVQHINRETKLNSIVEFKPNTDKAKDQKSRDRNSKSDAEINSNKKPQSSEMKAKSGEKKPESSEKKLESSEKKPESGEKKPESGEMKSMPEDVNILTLLIINPAFKAASVPFIKVLLKNSRRNPWVPREKDCLNPIQKAIEAKDRDIVGSLVNYCLEGAKNSHPAYLSPIIACLDKLRKEYHDLVEKVFAESSLIKVKNRSYVAANATIVNPQFSFRKGKYKTLDQHSKPVLHLRSQLPYILNEPSLLDRLLGIKPFQSNRTNDFPENLYRKEGEPTGESNSESIRDIYVAPFPKLSRYSDDGPTESAFSKIAGSDLIDNPSMIATLRFKWHMFGWKRWAFRFFLVLVYSLLFMVITALQIRAPDGYAKYIVGWDPAVYIVVALGSIGLIFEIWQFCLDPKVYIFSPYNYLDLVAFGLPIAGCIDLLVVSHEVQSDLGPTNIWVNSFALLAVYMNLLFELKVYRPLGTTVHILLSIAKRIFTFIVVLVVSMVAFTHAFMHITHTRRNYCGDLTGDELAACQTEHPETLYPQNPIRALFATTFFIAGIYDPLSNDIDSNDFGFKVMLVLFIFFTVILMMNVLIAIMNDGYGDSRDKGKLAWLIQWSEVIVEAEVTMMSNSTRRDRNIFPDYIYYGASSRDVEIYSEKDTQAVYFGDSTKSANEELHELTDNQKKLQSSIHAMSKYIKNLERQLGQRSSIDEVGGRELIRSGKRELVGVSQTTTTETITTTTNASGTVEQVVKSTTVAEHVNPDGTIFREDITSDKPSQSSNLNHRLSARPQIPMANILAGNANTKERRNTNVQ